MKPLKLKMTAFASYGGKQEIDFTKLKDGVYLITGKTGAGKTAIFDAMMYAMYGESSGSRDSKELRSHFADSDSQTEVAFTFLHNGRVYRAERKYITDKNGGYKGTDAYLYDEEDSIIQTGARNVTNAVIDIVGLSLNQFKNVIMLAQGEFKKFLTSETKDKALLLSQIFDSSLYKNFQETLQQTLKLLEDERAGEYAEIESQIEHYFKANAYDTVLLPDDEDLSEKADGILKKDKEALEVLKLNSASEQRIYDNILSEKATAQKLNKDIDSYYNALNAYNELEAKKSEYDQKQSELDRAEKFITHIETPYTNFVSSEKAFDEAKSNYEKNMRLTEEARLSFAQTQKAAEAIPELQEKTQSIKAQIETAKAALGKYELLDKTAAELNAVNALDNEKKNLINAVQKDLDEKKTALERDEKRLEELKNADVLELEARGECNKAREVLDMLKKAESDIHSILRDERKISEAKKEIAAAQQNYKDKLNEYTALYNNYFNASYGIIANKIRTKLETEDHTDCPVCGSIVTRSDAEHFAPAPKNAPKREQVERADAERRKAEEHVKEAEQKLKDIERDFEYQKRGVLNRVQPYIPEFTDWKKLTEDGKFKAKLKEFEEGERSAARKLSQAEINKEDRDALLKMKETAVPKIKELETRIDRLKDGRADISGKIIQLKTQIDGLQKDLRFSSLNEASADIEQKEKQAAGLQNRAAMLKSAESEAQKNLSVLEGSTKALEDSLRDSKYKLETDEILLNQKLEKFDYLSKEHALKDIGLIGEADREEWLASWRGEIAEYKEKLSEAKGSERELFKKLADGGELPDKADLQEIDSRLAEQKEKASEAKNAEITLSNLLDRRAKSFEAIKSSADKLKASDGAYERISRLAAIAGGRAGEKFDFERFMLGAIFKEILYAANTRLNTMSGGRYELEHSIKGSLGGNSQVGFEIEVFDRNTDTKRNPKSLSGGETFLTSLSLALGFSDVIARKSGGNKVEAMFIDEGFGSLDPSSLDTALSVLLGLTGEDYQIGIISHVDKLRESIPQKIRVTSDENGSRAEIE